MQLSTLQLAQFHKDGFIILRQFTNTEDCDAILSVAQEHLAKHIEPIETELGYDSSSKEYRTQVNNYNSKKLESQMIVRRLRQVYERDSVFKQWIENKKIRPILKQILSDRVVLTTAHHNSIMTKMPYESHATSWHQDRRYWRYSDNNLISVWLALGEENSENGALEFIPNSHRLEFDCKQFDEKEYFSSNHPINKKLILSKVKTILEKGDVVIFHSMLLHRANKNSTAQPKISFVYTVKGEKTKAISGTRSASFPEILLD